MGETPIVRDKRTMGRKTDLCKPGLEEEEAYLTIPWNYSSKRTLTWWELQRCCNLSRFELHELLLLGSFEVCIATPTKVLSTSSRQNYSSGPLIWNAPAVRSAAGQRWCWRVSATFWVKSMVRWNENIVTKIITKVHCDTKASRLHSVMQLQINTFTLSETKKSFME